MFNDLEAIREGFQGKGEGKIFGQPPVGPNEYKLGEGLWVQDFFENTICLSLGFAPRFLDNFIKLFENGVVNRSNPGGTDDRPARN
jgi:hypothetical protein